MQEKDSTIISKTDDNKKDIDILFIIPPFHMRNGGGNFFPLGLGYIISEVELAGLKWEVINCTKYINSLYKNDLEMLSKLLRKSLSEYSPSVVGIGPCITTQLRALKVLSSTCKSELPNVPLFAGGPLASIKDQEWIFYEELGIEYIIKGDGERAVVELIRAVKAGRSIASCGCVSYKGYSYINFIEDIDSISFPYRDTTINEKFSIRRTNDKKNQAAMISSRGCPYACNYCVSGNLNCNNIKYRKRSTENILDEMQLLNQTKGVSDIVFYDDCFFHSGKTVNSDVTYFCHSLKLRDLQVAWQIEMRPDIFCKLTDESMRELQEAGCRQISLGIEKISSSGLAFLGKRNCWPELKKQINQIKQLTSISISATFILGGDDENADDVKYLIEKSKELQLDFAHYNPLFIYPGTPIYDRVFHNNREWAKLIFEDNLPWGEIVYENSHLTCKQLIELVDYAYLEFYKNTPFIKQKMVTDRFNLKGKM